MVCGILPRLAERERGVDMPNEPGSYAQSNGLELWFRDEGNRAGQPLLLIMGLSSQLIHWPQEIVDGLGARGYRVIRFDNRDSGLSSKIEGVAARELEAEQNPKAAAYQLTDLANDAAGLLSFLDVPKAHIVGASMGGMIAQTLAIHHPTRVRSLCSIMSTTGNRWVGQPTLAAAFTVAQPTPPERERAIPHIVNVMNVIGSKTHREVEQAGRVATTTAAYDRMFYPQGSQRQIAAIFAATDRTADLGRLTVPTQIIHGNEDSLININGGLATHNAIPGSRYLPIATMGHDLPRALHAEIIEAIDANARRATA